MKEKKQRGLLRYLDGFWRQSILAPLFKLLEALFDLLVPLVVAEIINVGINQGDTGVILRCCGLLVLLGVVGLACSITAQWFAAQAAIGYASAMRHDPVPAHPDLGLLSGRRVGRQHPYHPADQRY